MGSVTCEKYILDPVPSRISMFNYNSRIDSNRPYADANFKERDFDPYPIRSQNFVAALRRTMSLTTVVCLLYIILDSREASTQSCEKATPSSSHGGPGTISRVPHPTR